VLQSYPNPNSNSDRGPVRMDCWRVRVRVRVGVSVRVGVGVRLNDGRQVRARDKIFFK
jgi:hypothetical protein